jgi:hypothetical protein
MGDQILKTNRYDIQIIFILTCLGEVHQFLCATYSEICGIKNARLQEGKMTKIIEPPALSITT